VLRDGRLGGRAWRCHRSGWRGCLDELALDALTKLNGVARTVPSQHVDVDPNHVERDMIAVMEAQRREFPQVGGFCQLPTLRQHTVTQRILLRWPDRCEGVPSGPEAGAAARLPADG
jgi:hypothetical protein